MCKTLVLYCLVLTKTVYVSGLLTYFSLWVILRGESGIWKLKSHFCWNHRYYHYHYHQYHHQRYYDYHYHLSPSPAIATTHHHPLSLPPSLSPSSPTLLIFIIITIIVISITITVVVVVVVILTPDTLGKSCCTCVWHPRFVIRNKLLHWLDWLNDIIRRYIYIVLHTILLFPFSCCRSNFFLLVWKLLFLQVCWNNWWLNWLFVIFSNFLEEKKALLYTFSISSRIWHL